MKKGVIKKGTVLSVSSGFSEMQWTIGSRIRVDGIEETYEAALRGDKTPTDYPAALKIVPHGDGPLPVEYQFFLNNVDPANISKWKNAGKIKNVSMPVLLGLGKSNLGGMNYLVIIMKRYENNVWSLFLKNGKKMNEHTVYKIGSRMLSTLQYIHTQSWTHGDIKGSNIMVDSSEEHIYLVNYHSASPYTSSNEQTKSNGTHNVVVEYMSRDAHEGVPTRRGDLESLFYNLIQWLGVRLPWEKNLENLSLVQRQKEDAFANVEQFLSECFERKKIPCSVRRMMNLIANLKQQDKPEYANFKLALRSSLLTLCHVSAGNLLFSLDNVSDDEQTEEGSSEAKQSKSRRGCKSTLGASVDQLAKIISKNCKSENDVNLQGEVVPGSLILAIYQITRMSRTNKRQKDLANAWEEDREGLRTKTKELWALKAKRKATRNTNSSEKEPEDSRRTSSAATAVSTQANNRVNLRHPGSSVYQSHLGAMSSNETLPQGVPASLNLLNVFSGNDVRSDSTSRSNVVQSPHFRASSSGYNSRSSSRVGFHSEDFALFRTPDTFLEKEPCQSSKEATEEPDSNNETMAERWRYESVGFESWHDNYELFNTWFDMKEKDLRAFGSIPSEPSMIISQVQQVRVLLDDFRTRTPRIRQLASALTKQPPSSADSQKLLRIQQRWQDQSNWLEKRGRELGEASLGQLREALQEVSSNLDKLLHEDPEEQQLRKVEILAGQLEAQRVLLASSRTVIEQLCQAFSDSTVSADLRNELRSVNNLYSDLQLRINVKKAEIERSLSDGRQFDESCKEIIVWLAEERDMSEKLTVSADPEKLQQQQQHYQCIMDKEIEVNELLRKSRDFLSRPQNRENVTQQRLHDLMKSQWDCLRKDSLRISSRLQICTERLNNYHQAKHLLLLRLNEIEHKLGSLRPASFNDLEEAPTKLSSLRTEIREKLKEFKQCAKLGVTFVKACDEDKDVVENELAAMKDRLEELNSSTQERAKFFKDTADNFFVCTKDLNDLGQRVDELKSRDTLQQESGDLNLIDSIKKLQKEVDSLQKPLQDVRQLVDELASKVGNQGIDTSSLLKGVDEVAGDIESLGTKLIKSLNMALERKLHSIENDIKPKINIEQEQDVKPSIPLLKINWPPGMVIDLTSDNEDEIDCAREEKAKGLLLNTNTLSEEVVDSECAQTHLNQFEEVLKNGEQSSKAASLERKSQEEKDVSIASSSRANEKSENGKRKRYIRIRSGSDSSDSDYDAKK